MGKYIKKTSRSRLDYVETAGEVIRIPPLLPPLLPRYFPPTSWLRPRCFPQLYDFPQLLPPLRPRYFPHYFPPLLHRYFPAIFPLFPLYFSAISPLLPHCFPATSPLRTYFPPAYFHASSSPSTSLRYLPPYFNRR